jgi:hypothetical protein
MSDIPADYRERLDLREQLARIDKLLVENQKLQAETKKHNRDPWILALAALIAAFATLFARLPELLTVLGVGR